MDNIKEYMLESPDHNEIRLEKLKELFPDIFSNEGKLNLSELKKIIDKDSVNESEKFEFSWFGKTQAKRNAFTPSNETLILDHDRSVKPELSDGNMIIEGENLTVLKLLTSSYRNQIKCIYIDPPYNTGKDFVYTDKFKENREDYWESIGITEEGIKVDTNKESDGRFHSNWLNLMYSRLLVARQLLHPEGVIFVSIDENEVHHLKMLMNEVFGEANFIEQISWKNKYGAGAKTKGFISVHEYILCYSKEPIRNIESELTDEQIAEYDKRDEKYETRGGYITQPLMTKSLDERENLQYTIEYNGEKIIPRKQWVWEEDRLLKAINNNEVVFNKMKDGTYSVRAKQYLKLEDGTIRKGKPLSWFNGPFNQEGTKEIEQIFGNSDIFDFPKPKELIKYLLSFAINENYSKDGIFLDFFGGSGTTAQAVMELNKEDGGNRKFILIQLNEQIDEKEEAFKAGYRTISDITIERNKRLILGYGDNPVPLDTGFKVYKLAKSNFPRTEFTPDINKTEQENVELLKAYIKEKEKNILTLFNKEDVLNEVLLKCGFMLDYQLQEQDEFKENKVYYVKDADKEALICLDIHIENETIALLGEKQQQYKFICLEASLDTTSKWNLKHILGSKLKTI